MERIRHFFRTRWDVVLLAFIIGSLVIAPSLYFRYGSGTYRGIEMFRADAELNYLAQIQEVMDGHPSLGNIYVADGKDAPHAIQQPLAAMVMGYAGNVFGLTAPDTNLYAKFVFPFFLTFVVFYFLLFLTGERWMALVGTAFIMLAPASPGFFVPTAWWQMVAHGIFPDADYQFLHYSRSINPQFSTFFFYGYFFALWKFLYRPKRVKLEGVVAAILLGASFYTYFFVYSFVSVFTAVLFFWYLARRDFIRAKKIVAVSLGGIFLALPALINTIQAMRLPLYAQATQRVGAFIGRKFIFSRVWWGAFIILLLLWRRITNEALRVFVLVFLLTGFILTNQQVLTNRLIPAPQHYHWYYLAPFIGALFFMLLVAAAKRVARTRGAQTAACLILLGLLVWVGVLFQKRSYEQYVGPVTDEQRYAGVLQWLGKNTPKDAAVLGNDAFSHLVVGYTHDNAYYHRGLTDFMMPTGRLRDAYFAYAYLGGLTKPADVAASFKADRQTIGSWLYGEYYRQMNGCSGCFPDAILDMLVADYTDFLAKDFFTELKRYPVDYIVWDKEKDPKWDIGRFSKDPVYDDGRIAVYTIS